jgi:hypothetical protein
MQLNSEELAIIYSTLEECLNSDGWDNLADEIGGIMDKVKLQLKQPRQ